MKEVTPTEVKERIESGDIQVVDIRSPAEFKRGHIPDAINIPMMELPVRVSEVDWGDEIVCACPIGQSSIQAARLLASFEGVPDDASVASMEGGYEAWDYELERES